MPLYEKVDVQVSRIVERLIEKYHGPLRDAGLTVDLLFAKAATNEEGESEGPALKLHGYRCAAIARIVPYKLRVQGHADAEIVIDGDRWPEWSEEERDARLDHELEHFELTLDKYGLVRRDDLDRPKLRIRLHDHQFGWFDAIARRHGKDSIEVQQYEAFKAKHRQLWLAFESDPVAGTIKGKGRDKKAASSG